MQADHDDASVFVVGLTDFAQEALGEVTLVQVRDIGTNVGAGDELGEVEAFKAMTDLYMPVTATVIGVNPALADEPTTLNSDPYGSGWLCRIRPERLDDIEALLDAASYNALIGVD